MCAWRIVDGSDVASISPAASESSAKSNDKVLMRKAVVLILTFSRKFTACQSRSNNNTPFLLGRNLTERPGQLQTDEMFEAVISGPELSILDITDEILREE